MKNYKDVKVGDKFYYEKKIGVSKYSVLYFAKCFFIECEVLKVTNSQFTTDSGRYRKSDGYGIGDSPSIYKEGEVIPGFLLKSKIVPGRCQKIDMSDYDSELQLLREAQRARLDLFDITKVKGFENAQKAASLVMQLKDLMNGAG